MADRKSLFDISWQVDEPTYREDPGYSYSTLAKFNREGFSKLDSLFDRVSTPSLTFGSMVDTLLTDGEAAFNERFFVANFSAISDSIINIVKELFAQNGDKCLSLNSIPDNIILDCINLANYQPRWKAETRIKDIRDKGSEYYNQLIISNGREVVSQEDYQDCLNCVDALRNSEATKEYFKVTSPWEDKERLYQLKFRGTYEGINLRCMADLIIVDHKNKTVQPCDLKTSSHMEYEFHKSFIQWNYWIQAQLYWYIIRQNMDADPYFKDFKLLDYVFIVVNRKTVNPLTWVYDKTMSEVDITLPNGFVCRNWRTIVKELDYYLKNPSRVPIGIVYNKPNSITSWLETNM